MDLAECCIVSPPVEGGPPKFVSEGGTWCSWRLVQYHSHSIILYSQTLHTLGEVGTAGVPDHLAVVRIRQD